MITAEVIHRVFHIRYGTGTGTAFAADIDGKQYIITARHIVETIVDLAEIEMHYMQRWRPTPVKLVGHAEGETDISVLTTDRVLTPKNLHLGLGTERLTYGQDMFFLGFPYGMMGGHEMQNWGYPLPFVKRASLATMPGEDRLAYLDGMNNPGFSGGPVVFQPPREWYFKVGYVVSGYRYEPGNIFNAAGLPYDELIARHNSGLVVAHDVWSAVEIARSNPIGIPLD